MIIKHQTVSDFVRGDDKVMYYIQHKPLSKETTLYIVSMKANGNLNPYWLYMYHNNCWID